MLHSDIIKIAVKNGWQVTIINSDNGLFFDFHRRTLGGLPFSFTAELTDGLVGTLVDEIISFVDALDPERYACEWMECKGDVSPARYLKTVDDMDEMRTHAWLLAVELSTAAEKGKSLLDLPWYSLN